MSTPLSLRSVKSLISKVVSSEEYVVGAAKAVEAMRAVVAAAMENFMVMVCWCCWKLVKLLLFDVLLMESGSCVAVVVLLLFAGLMIDINEARPAPISIISITSCYATESSQDSILIDYSYHGLWSSVTQLGRTMPLHE